MKFSVIYADPPWPYDDKGVRGGTGNHYDDLSLEQIMAMPVHTLAQAHSLLFLWVTRPMEDEGRMVLRSWGFRFYGEAFTWVKYDSGGNPWLGNGRLTRANTEGCLVGVRGRGLPRLDASISQVVDTYGPRPDHSSKPDEVADRIVQLVGDVPRLELFARRHRPGWETWGDEVLSDPDITQTLFPDGPHGQEKETSQTTTTDRPRGDR